MTLILLASTPSSEAIVRRWAYEWVTSASARFAWNFSRATSDRSRHVVGKESICCVSARDVDSLTTIGMCRLAAYQIPRPSQFGNSKRSNLNSFVRCSAAWPTSQEARTPGAVRSNRPMWLRPMTSTGTSSAAHDRCVTAPVVRTRTVWPDLTSDSANARV